MKQPKLLLIGILTIIVLSSFAYSFDYSDKKGYQDWILFNFPIFEIDNIPLELRDSFHKQELFIIDSKKIIVNIEHTDIGSNLLRSRVTHGLMHYYCLENYGDADAEHTKCFSPDYNLGKSAY